MRTLTLLVIALAACGGKKSEPAAGSGSAPAGSGSGASVSAGSGSGSNAATGSGSAVAAGSGSAAPTAGFCVPAEGTNSLEAFVADAKSATFCLGNEEYVGDAPVKKTACTSIDLATGAIATATAPAAPTPALEIKQTKTDAQVCKGGACVKLAVPVPPDSEELTPYTIRANADGTLVAVTGNELKNVLILDAKTGKKKQTLKVGDGDYKCIGYAQFLGDVVYIVNTVCAGPGGKGYLFRDGKQFSTVEGVNVYGSDPVQVDGDLWAVAGFGGGDLSLVDVKSGKTVRTIQITRPEECDGCDSIDGAMMNATPLVKSGSKLAAISAFGVTIIDPQTGAVEKTHRFKPCAPKT